MELQLLNANGEAGGTVNVSDKTFGADFNEALVHQVVTAYMAAARSGTKAQKTRAERRGGGAKPWRQKGTGRARAGTNSSPIWRGGGKVFAARPRDYSQKVNRKMYRAALRSILSELLRQDRLVVVDTFSVDEPKTKPLLEKLRALKAEDVLIVTDALDRNLALSARNVYAIDVVDVERIDPVSLVHYQKVLFTAGAVKQLEESLA